MNDLTKTFCHLIDTDKGYDNLALAEQCEQITDDFAVKLLVFMANADPDTKIFESIDYDKSDEEVAKEITKIFKQNHYE